MSNEGLSVSVTRAKPSINVTPLIDVLLVMLIIFMVAAPLKPQRFLAKVPTKPDLDNRVQANIDTLVVTINPDLSLKLNGLTEMGSVNDMSKITATLSDLFQRRTQNHVYRYELRDRVDIPDSVRVEKTVFIKAPRAMPYADVVLVLDGLKGAGASPIGLQIDDLN